MQFHKCNTLHLPQGQKGACPWMKLIKIAYLNIPKDEYLMGVTTKGTQKARLQSGTYTSGYKREGIPGDEASHNFWAQSKIFSIHL